MQQALISVIDQLILECDDERARLKEKKVVLEGVRSALVTSQPSAESSSTEPPAKKSKKRKDDVVVTSPAPVDDIDKKRKKKEKKDPNKPKRALTAYTLFFLEYSKKYKTDHPEVAQKDIMGVVGLVWKEMDAQQKAPYEARATVLKAEHAEAMSFYTEGSSSSVASVATHVAAAASSPVKAAKVSAKVKTIPTPTSAPVRKNSLSSSSSSSSESDSEPEPEPVKKSKKSK